MPKFWLRSGCVGHDKTQTVDHADCADRAGCVTFMFPFFLNCYLYMIKVCTSFSYLFGNIGTVSSLWKLHGKIFYVALSGSRYLAKQNHGVKFLKLMQISPTRQDVICVGRDSDLEVRNVLCERSKWLPGSSQDSQRNCRKLKSNLIRRFLNRGKWLIGSHWVGNFGHVSIEVW